MTDPELPLEGTCRCGAVRLRITEAPLLTMACHCTGCQRMSSSAYSLSAAIPTAGFAVVAGEPAPGGLAGSGHFFCPQCMSWMFTRAPEKAMFVNVRPTLFDDTRWFAPFVETWTSAALPFAKTGAVHSFPQFPAMEAYGPLVEAYARTVGRP